MSHAALERHPGTTHATGARWRVAGRVAFLLTLSGLFLAGWFSSLPPQGALDAGLRVLTVALFVLASDLSPRMQPGRARAFLYAAALIFAAGEFAWHIYLSAATELSISFAWGYTGVLLVMLLIAAVRLIRDRRAHTAAAAADTAEPAAPSRAD
ncbi:hypothetical protein [Brevibacterium luteolum]|uniref:hypothetical protein n=1 Tax=Brevibacterium luteolum TaxID=199591 RepID=UPI001C2400D8|nr:hypothetical protein [Brevibacterium luteolum]MBU8577753.1 hypothetical protein [Brevibacterium luteolum]